MTQHAKQRTHFLPFFYGIITRDTYSPCGGPCQSSENAQKRRLASPIRPKYTQATSTLEFEIKASKSCDSTKMFDDTLKMHHGFGAHAILLHVSITCKLAALLCSASISVRGSQKRLLRGITLIKCTFHWIEWENFSFLILLSLFCDG